MDSYDDLPGYPGLKVDLGALSAGELNALYGAYLLGGTSLPREFAHFCQLCGREAVRRGLFGVDFDDPELEIHLAYIAKPTRTHNREGKDEG